MRKFMVGLVVAGALALWRGEARACDPLTPFAPYVASPSAGQTDVPTNVRARVLYFQQATVFPELSDVIIRPLGGAAVAAEITTARNDFSPFTLAVYVKPTAPLAANTMYELAGKMKPNCSEACLSADYVVINSFRTGAGPDNTAPTFAGIQTLDSENVICDNGACCGPFTGIRFGIHFPSAQDSDVVEYRIFRDGELVSVAGAVGFDLCSGDPSGRGPGGNFINTGGRYTVHAVDLAGNVDTNSAGLDIGLDCAAVSAVDAGVSGPDAAVANPDGPTASPDARLPDAPVIHADAPGPPTTNDTSGCAVGGGPTLLGVLPALWLFRRRRKSARM